MSLYLCVCVCILKVWYSVPGAVIAVNKIPSFSGTTMVFLLFLCSKHVSKVVGKSILHY